MASYNKVILMGNLTRDVDLRTLPSGDAVADIGIAVNRKFKKSDGSQGEEVLFAQCTAFGKQAETLKQYVTKGSPLFIEGRLRNEEFTDREGKKQSKTRIVIEKFEFIGGGREAGTDAPAANAKPNGRQPDPAYREPIAQEESPF